MATNYRIILASHGELSKGMLNTVQMLLGQQENIIAYCLYPEEDVNGFAAKLRKEVEEYGAENIIFMTELLHGSPFNSVVGLTRDYHLHHISGTNLATLMGAIMERDDEDATADSICEAAMEASENSIADVLKLLGSADDDEEDEEDL